MKTAYSFIQKNIFICTALLALAVVVTAILYGVLVQSAVVNVVERENIEADASELALRLGELEFSYIDLKNQVTIEHAYALGYTDINNPTYLSRSTALSVLTSPRVQ